MGDTKNVKRNVNKSCFIPKCENSTKKNPQKIFIVVPANLQIKTRWFEAAGRELREVSTTTKFYCCEDHFKLEEDMENYVRFRLCNCRIRMKPDVVPHIFNGRMDDNPAVEYIANNPKHQQSTSSLRDKMPSCSVLTCKNTSVNTKGTDIRFFRFPRHVEFAKRWQNACGRTDKVNVKNARICSVHFDESSFVSEYRLFGFDSRSTRLLKSDAIPTLLLDGASSNVTAQSSALKEEDANDVNRELVFFPLENTHQIFQKFCTVVSGLNKRELVLVKEEPEEDNSIELLSIKTEGREMDTSEIFESINEELDLVKEEPEEYNPVELSSIQLEKEMDGPEMFKSIKKEEMDFDYHDLSTEYLSCDEMKIEKFDYIESESIPNDDDSNDPDNSRNSKLKKFQRDDLYDCPFCSLEGLKGSWNLESHILVKHHDNDEAFSYISKSFSCHFCKYRSVYRKNFNRHLDQVHNSEMLEERRKSIEYKRALMEERTKFREIERNRRTIKEGKKYRMTFPGVYCHHCGYKTRYKANLARHLRIHNMSEEQRPFTCRGCDKRFNTKHGLDTHIVKWHANDKELIKLVTNSIYQCQKCSYLDLRHSKLLKHFKQNHSKHNVNESGFIIQ